MAAPTKYRPEYCDDLIQHMAQGYSFEAFAGKLGVHKQTLYNWAAEHTEFFDAKKVGFERNRYFWETVAIASATGKPMIQRDAAGNIKSSTQANPTMVIFNLKNRFPSEWRDRHDIVHEVGDTPEQALLGELLRLTPDQIKDRRKQIIDNENRYLTAKDKAGAIDVEVIKEVMEDGDGPESK